MKREQPNLNKAELAWQPDLGELTGKYRKASREARSRNPKEIELYHLTSQGKLETRPKERRGESEKETIVDAES